MVLQVFTDSTPADSRKWEEFVESHPHGNFFQTMDAFSFYRSLKNYKPVLICAYDEGEIIGGLLAIMIREEGGIKGFFSRRCIIWGGPLVKNNHPEIADHLISNLNQVARRNSIYTEFRNFFDPEPFREVFRKHGFIYKEHLNFIVETGVQEKTLKQVSNSKIRQIRKSLANGAKITEALNIDEIRSFYLLLKRLYAVKIKKPLPSWDFFETFFLDKKLGRYFLITYNNEVVGGIMCPIYKETIYEFYVCGLDAEYKDIYPSVLATWAPIEYAVKNGLKYFDFMGAGNPDEGYGVREFKARFGGKEVNFGRYVQINNRFLYTIGKAGLSILNKIKNENNH